MSREEMRELQRKFQTSLLMITHNLGIVADICEKVAVMYAGSVVEFGSTREVFTNPRHPYTKGLFNAIPDIKSSAERLIPIKGEVPNALKLPSGCRFHPRCSMAAEECKTTEPRPVEVCEGHYASCLKLCGMKGGEADV
jgi:peptide/nickel transport system ATP-binding protein